MPEPPMTPRTALVMMANSEWRTANGDVSWRRGGECACSLFATRYAHSPSGFSFHRHLAPGGFAARLHLVPDLLLGEVHEEREDDQEDHHLETDALALFQMRLRGPHQERGDIPGVLRDGLRRAVGIVDATVGQRRRHRDGVAGKIP